MACRVYHSPMKPNLIDHAWRALGRFEVVRDMIDLGLHQALNKTPSHVQRWLWRRAPHAHHAEQKSFGFDLHFRAYSLAVQDGGDPKDQARRWEVLDLLHDAGLFPDPLHRETRLIGLAGAKGWKQMFAIAQGDGITSGQASLALSTMLHYLQTPEDEQQALRWARQFQVDPAGMEHFSRSKEVVGAISSTGICPLEQALHRCSNELILGLLNEVQHVPARVLRALVGREKALSVEVVQRLDRLRIAWTDALIEECPDQSPLDRFAVLARAIPGRAGNLVDLLSQAREMNRVEDEHLALSQSTIDPVQRPQTSLSGPRRRI